MHDNFAIREDHQTGMFNDQLHILMGKSTTVPLNDIWTFAFSVDY